jgi:hypothetical protein
VLDLISHIQTRAIVDCEWACHGPLKRIKEVDNMKTRWTVGIAYLLWNAVILQAGSLSGPAPIVSPSESTILADAPIIPSAAREFRLAYLEAPLLPSRPSPAPVVNHHTNSRAWKLSLLALAGATSADALSSWGKQEGNPLLRSSNGTFGLRGLAIKSGLTGVSFIPQYIMRNNPKAQKMFTVLNFAETAMFTALAVHNFSIPPVKVVE